MAKKAGELRWSGEVDRASAWLAASLEEGDLVPSGFDAYVQVFHPVELDPTGSTPPVRWREVSAWSGVPIESETYFEAIARPSGRPVGARPWSGQGPTEGTMYLPDARVLAGILEEFTTTPQSCWFGLWEGRNTRIEISFRDGQSSTGFIDAVPPEGRGGPLLALSRDWKYHLFHGPVRSALDPPFGDLGHVTPAFWWPDDHAWVVMTNEDFAWTYVGGREDLVATLLHESRLEVIRCNPFAPTPWAH